MRPLALSMTAFGPFPHTEAIDFAVLGENPLFLINGPTGSGKTTILDAICFALYGRTTGDEREAAQMRCDLAGGETIAEVTFTFELGGRRYRIRRIPEQQRPKSRGEGTTIQATEAQLYELKNGGEERLIVASKVTEANREIEALTGLSADQFRQVMVLPQGKFRELLLAPSLEREKIFSQLFQTGIYRQLEEALKSQAAGIRQEREKKLQVRKGILEGAGVATPEALEEEIRERTPNLELLKAEKTRREAIYTGTVRAQEEARGLGAAFALLDDYLRQQAVLGGMKEEFEAKRTRLSLAEEARKLKPAFDECGRRERDLEQAKGKLSAAHAAQKEATRLLERADSDFKAAEAKSSDLDLAKQKVARLKSYRDRAQRLESCRRRVEEAKSGLKTAEEALKKAENALAETARQRSAALEEQAACQTALFGFGDLQVKLQQVSERLTARREMENLLKACAALESRLAAKEAEGKRLREEYAEKEEQAKRLELAWHQGQAAILARDLRGGSPCPVCGSTVHPHPASSKETLPSQEELEAARLLAQNARQALEEARDGYQDLKGEATSCRKDLGKIQEKLGAAATGPLDELVEEHRSLQKKESDLLGLRERIDALAPLLDSFKAAEEQARQTAEASRGLVAERGKELAADQAQAQSAEQELPQEYREPGALERAIARVQEGVVQIEKEITGAREAQKLAHGRWEGACATHKAAQTAEETARRELTVALETRKKAFSGSPLSCEEDYQRALVDEKSLEALKKAINEYELKVERLEAVLETQQQALHGKARPDLAQATEAMLAAETEKEEAIAAANQVAARLELLQRTRKQLTQAAADLDQLDRQYAVVGTLSDVANGQTGDKISLQRFVLGVLLDDVLVEASQRLVRMSKGRYRLLRREDRVKGRKASGLELDVEDTYTGKVRPVATLSGGESFIAALSLALGLSDVVQAYAGGIRLDTLFIDEGFGSLDAESLDLAIRTLVDLQATGRMVGIISHVAELKEQMPRRFDILASRTGSTIRVVAP